MDAKKTNSMMPAGAQVRARAWEDAFRLTHEPLLSSTSVSWHDIDLEYQCQSPSEVPEHQDAEHEIYIPHFQCDQAMQWTIDGCYQQRQMGRGEIAIIPAHVSHSLSWDFDAEFTIISLAPSLVSRIAEESSEPVTVELSPIFAQVDPLICQVGAALKSVLETDGVYSRLFADSAATLLAAHLLAHYSVTQGSKSTDSGGLPNYKLRRALTYIQEHLDQNLSLSAIAASVSMSQYHFSRLFKQSMGISVHQYVIQSRVECAKQLLLQHELSVTDVALRVGFANPSHLSHHFKRTVGVTPKTFLNQ